MATSVTILDGNGDPQTVLTIDGTVGPAGTANTNVQTVQGIAAMTPLLVTLSGTNALPTGASTAAKQPALGTAGTASTDVITVQGIAAMTPLLATLSGTNNIATVTTVTTVAAVTAISNALPAGTNLLGKVSASDETSTVYNGTTALTPKFAKIAAASSGANEVVAAVSGKKIRVLAYNFMGSSAVNAKWQSASTDLSGLKYLAANTGIVAGYNKAGWLETASTEALNLNLSGAVAVGGELVYVEV